MRKRVKNCCVNINKDLVPRAYGPFLVWFPSEWSKYQHNTASPHNCFHSFKVADIWNKLPGDNDSVLDYRPSRTDCPTPPWSEHLYLTWTIHPCWYRAFEFLLVQWSMTTKTSSGPLELALPWVCWTISFDEKYQAFSQPKPQNCLYLCSPFPGVLCLVKGSH